MITNLSEGSDILALLGKADLLLQCGGPYPQDPAVLPVESLPQALKIISGSLFDAVPNSNLDKTLHRAFHTSYRTLKHTQGFLARLRFGNVIRTRKRQIAKMIESRMAHATIASQLTATDRIIIVSHLSELLNVVSLILDSNHNADWQLLIKAASFTLDGYLPVDLLEADKLQRIQLY